MAGQPPEFPPVPTGSPHPALDPVSPNLFRHRQFWLRLAAYRPLLVLGGMWLLIVTIALVAYGRLLNTGTQPSPSSTSTSRGESAFVLPQPPAPSRNPVPTIDSVQGAAQGESTQDSDEMQPSPWALALMVALCAGGCFVISQQIQAKPQHRPPPKARRRPQVTLAAAVPDSRSPGAIAPPPQSGPQSAPVLQPRRIARVQPAPLSGSPQAPAAGIQPEVVPRGATTAVDWPAQSLVHQADLRQHRPLSSFLGQSR